MTISAAESTAYNVSEELAEFDRLGDQESKTRHFPYLSVDAKMTVLYREVTAFRADVADMEKKAAAMADPENMMKMAEKFLGNGFM